MAPTVAPALRTRAAVARSLVGVRRFPASRIARLVLFAALGGVAAAWTVERTPLAAIVVVAAAFVIGLEVVEPLAEEIDRPSRTDALPLERGWLYVRLLPISLALVVALGLVGAVSATIVGSFGPGPAFAVAPSVALLGVAGAIASTVSGAAPPPGVADSDLFGRDRAEAGAVALPEFAGFAQVSSGLLPVAVSAPAAIPLLAARVDGVSAVDLASRSAFGAALVLAGVGWWVRRRDRWAVGVRRFFAEGRAST